MTRSDLDRLYDARDHTRQAFSRLTGMGEGVSQGREELFQAFLFNLVVIGTAFGKISKPVRALSSDVPWRDVIDTRNRVVHAYWQVEPGLLSNVTVGRLERLLVSIEDLIDLMIREAS